MQRERTRVISGVIKLKGVGSSLEMAEALLVAEGSCKKLE